MQGTPMHKIIIIGAGPANGKTECGAESSCGIIIKSHRQHHHWCNGQSLWAWEFYL